MNALQPVKIENTADEIEPVPIFYGRSVTGELAVRLNQHPNSLKALVSLKKKAGNDFSKFLNNICDVDNSIKFSIMSEKKTDRLNLFYISFNF